MNLFYFAYKYFFLLLLFLFVYFVLDSCVMLCFKYWIFIPRRITPYFFHKLFYIVESSNHITSNFHKTHTQTRSHICKTRHISANAETFLACFQAHKTIDNMMYKFSISFCCRHPSHCRLSSHPRLFLRESFYQRFRPNLGP